MIKMVNRNGHLTEGAKKAFAGAYRVGYFNESIRIPNGYENIAVWKRLHALTGDMDIWLTFIDEDAIVSYDHAKSALKDMSKTAAVEFAGMFRAYDFTPPPAQGGIFTEGKHYEKD